MLIGKRLREARKAHNLSAEQLGNMIGVTKAAVSLYENEKRNPKIETLIEIMYALGVSSDYLLGADKFVELKDPTIHYETLTNEEDALGKFVHPNGSTTLIREGLIKVDSSKRRNYLMHVVDGERFDFP